MKGIRAGVIQGSVFEPTLYLLYTADLPELENITTATFVDDTEILAVSKDLGISTNKLQLTTDQVYNWTKKWRIKLN